MVAEDAEDTELALEFDWSSASDLNAQVATQFLVQLGIPAGDRPDGIFLVVGHADPPLIVGTNAASRQEQAARYGGKLPVTVHGRYYLSRLRLEELRRALNDLAKRYDDLLASEEQSHD